MTDTPEEKSEKLTKLDVVKFVATTVVSFATGAVVTNAVRATSPTTAKTLPRIVIGIGSFVLSGIVSDFASKYAEDKIDESVEGYTKAKQTFEDNLRKSQSEETPEDN